MPEINSKYPANRYAGNKKGGYILKDYDSPFAPQRIAKLKPACTSCKQGITILLWVGS